MDEDEMNESTVSDDTEVPCECCGAPATRYFTSWPICSNQVCFIVRDEELKDYIKRVNNKVALKAMKETYENN